MRHPPFKSWCLGLTLAASTITPLGAVQANWFSENFRDPSAGKLDLSKWLGEKKGFMPVPIIITEPAVGYELGKAVTVIPSFPKE